MNQEVPLAMTRSVFGGWPALRTAVVVAVGLVALGAGCGSLSASSKSISKSISSPFKSSSRSSSPADAYRDDVRDFTAAYMKSGGDPSKLKAEVSSVAEKHGVTDWESSESTYVGIGAGLAEAKVSSAELEAYKKTIATNAEQAQWMQKGYDSAK
jgi:hypothetical protein